MAENAHEEADDAMKLLTDLRKEFDGAISSFKPIYIIGSTAEKAKADESKAKLEYWISRIDRCLATNTPAASQGGKAHPVLDGRRVVEELSAIVAASEGAIYYDKADNRHPVVTPLIRAFVEEKQAMLYSIDRSEK